MTRLVSFLVLVAILVIISIIFFQVMAGFFVPLFLAALLGVVVQPLHRWIVAKCRGYRHLAAGVTTTLVALIVLLPIGFVVTTATLEGLSLLDQLQLADVRVKLQELRRDFGLEIPQEHDLRRIEAVLRTWRDKQRRGEPLHFEPDQVKGLIARVENVEKWIRNQPPDHVPAREADATALKAALQELVNADPAVAPAADDPLLAELPEELAVRQEDALLVADAEFREFKRNLLGGTYRAWLTEWANPSEEQIEQLRASVLAAAGPVLTIGGDTLLLLAKIGFGTLIMMVALFFLLAEGPPMLEATIKILPLEEHYVRELGAEFDRACRAIVSATLLSALAQGLLAGIGFYFCGLRSSVALLTLLTMVLALVPFTGAAAVWIPVSLWLYFYHGSLAAAVGLALYGTFVISASDNVIKPIVLHGQSNLHPLLALLSVLGGIQALGPIGIVVGPMVVVFLQTLLKILQRELMSLDRSSWSFWRGLGAATGPPPAVTPTTAAMAAASAAEVPAPASPPRAAGNGSGAAGAPRREPQPHGKKRRK
jgi:predicted PurR-regulated permease PerM